MDRFAELVQDARLEQRQLSDERNLLVIYAPNIAHTLEQCYR